MRISLSQWYTPPMRRLLPLLLVLAIASPAWAWSRAGHMIVGAIAYDDLKANHPGTLAKWIAVLHGHPLWATFEKRINAVAPENRDRYLLMVAGRWADDIRDDKALSHPLWHYIDYPVTAPGDTTPTSPPDEDNAITALTQQAAVLKDRSAKPADRAIAACWVEHIVGDVHQPMHTVSLFSAKLPKGDKGGNLIWVQAERGGQSVNLHALWDTLLTDTESYQNAANIATALRLREDTKRDALAGVKEMDPNAWVKESVDIAYRLAYLNGKIESGTKKQGALLPAGYLKNAKAAAEKRTALAGYRLADAMVVTLGE